MKHALVLTSVLLALTYAAHADSPVIITEFMASNTRTLADEDGTYSDWIELQNVSADSVDLNGWFLTDDPGSLRKWRIPPTTLPRAAFLIVFASGKDRVIPERPLHTNFRLSATGEYLALVEPDGQTIATQFRPAFPMQFSDVSYGPGVEQTNYTLIPSNAALRAYVPVDGSLSNSWMRTDFDDTTWLSGTNAAGFDAGTPNPGEDFVASTILASGPVLYYRMSEISGTTIANLGANGLSGSCQSVTLNAAGPRPPTYGGFEANNAAAQFNGTQLIRNGGGSFMNDLSAFTMSAWINLAGTPATKAGLFGQNDAFECGFSTASNLQLWTAGGGSVNYAWTPANNQWYHVALVGDGANLRVYINGALAATGGSATASYGSSSYPFNIGGGGVFDASGNWFNGMFDEVAVWSRALSAAEIQQQYQGAIAPNTTAIYSNLIGCDLSGSMAGVNGSCYLRYLFQVEDPSLIDQLTLTMKYDDGFAAYINGALVAWRNAPGELMWNSAATNYNMDGAAMIGEAMNISSSLGVLTPGTNVLAIHGLNRSATNSDFLISAELTAVSVGSYSSNGFYFTVPTPGGFNGLGVKDLGPVISSVGHTPAAPLVPTASDSIVVTARVEMAFAPVTNVTLYYRVMYNATNVLAMVDDGMHGDGLLNDGIFGATIPAGVAANGQMIRWFISADDRLGRNSRWPVLHPTTPGPQFEGTMFLDPAVASQLPIWYFFVDPNSASRTGIDTENGGRLSMFFNGEFYDNIYMELRGNTTAGYPKKSHRIEFTPDRPLQGAIPGWELRHTSLLSEQADPSYLRTDLSHWLMQQMGVPGPVHYPVHCRMNGQFWGLWFHNDVVGAEQLERLGYDSLGALYKAAGTVETSHYSTGVFEKKTRLWEGTLDFDTLAANINTNQPLLGRKNFIFDNLNLPEVVNYLAVARWTQEGDDVWANMTLYRDSLNTREWFVVPFDLNVSWGQLYCGDAATSFNVVVATNDPLKSHPFYGGSQVPVSYRTTTWNRIYDVIIAVPETREMLLRRMRTMMERFIQPPGTTSEQGILEQRIAAMTNIMWAEMFLDRAAWGWPCSSGTCGMYCWGQPMPTDPMYGVPGIISNFIQPRRVHWWETHCITNTAKAVGLGTSFNAGIPVSQPADAVLMLLGLDANPISGNQDQEYICLTNPQPCALDISGWQLDGAVNFTFAPGTIIPSNSTVYVSPNVYAFRSRSTGPRGGQGLFVVGPYKGQLSARGETIRVLNDAGRAVWTESFPGHPSPAQQFLRVTELMYNPALPPTGGIPEDFEYIELKNISTDTSLDLTGVRFTDGIVFNFTGSAVTNLAPGATVLVVRRNDAFASVYGTGLPVAGQYWSYALGNGGERLRLVDAVGEEILDFTFDNEWYPITDGLGFSLVAVDENAQPDAWSEKSQWRPSSTVVGSPGRTDPAPAVVAPVFVNEALSRTDSPPPTDTIELYNPTTNEVDISGWCLTDDFLTPFKFRIPSGTRVPPQGFVTFDELQFNVNPALPSSFALSADGDEVFLFGVDTNSGNLNGYYHGFRFGAAEEGVSFGRYVTSVGEEHFVAQVERSFLTNNPGPAVGPVVISEIMYHPLDWGTNDNVLDEFIELLNITSNTVPLYYASSPTNTWKLTGGVDYAFPTNVSLQAGESLVLVNFAPTNTSQLALFRSLYNVPTNVQVFGPYTGKLNNNNDEIELKKPTLPVLAKPDVAPYVLVERVAYRDAAPWPGASDGLGFSLHRWVSGAYGNDPTNWVSAHPNPGSMTLPGSGWPWIVEQPASQTVMVGETVAIQVTAVGEETLTYQWRLDGVKIPDATNSFMVFTNASAEFSGQYDVLIENGLGAVLSSAARISIRSPLIISQHPQEVMVRVAPDPLAQPTNVTFTVGVSSVAAVHYQWRFNGMDIPNATNSVYTIEKVATNHWGQYSVFVRDDVSSELSRSAWLYPFVRLQVLQAPVSQSVPVNSQVTLVARISGWPPPFTFEWRRGSVGVYTNVQDDLVNFYTFTAPATPTTGSYRITVRNVGQPTGAGSLNFNITTVADADGDGMPDTWENLFGLSPTNSADQLLDSDGDGYTNAQEYTAGTDPTNSLSFVAIDSVILTNDRVRIDFKATATKTYSVQGNDLSSSNWWTVGHVLGRTTNWSGFTFDSFSTNNRFYRLVTPSQP